MDRERDRALLVALALGLLVLYIGEGRLATGVYNDDDIGHYLMARDAIARPELFLNLWGRPLFTLVYALPAQLGFDAVRIVTAVITALAVVATGVAGRCAGLSAPLAGGLFGTMPFVLLLSYSSLTEPLAALVVALALGAWFARRPTRAFLLAGFVPLARLELAVAVGICALFYLIRTPGRGRLCALLAGAGILVWAAAGAVVHGEAGWFLGQIFTGEENLYGQTGFWHYLRGLIFVVGPVVFLFLLVDLVASVAARRWDLLTLLPGCVLFLYMLLSWQLSVGHAAGFLRHLVAPAPLFALAAGRGCAEALRGGAAARRARAVLAVGTVVIAVFLSRALVKHHRAEGPYELIRITAALLVLAALVWATRVAGTRRAPRRAALAGALLVALALLHAVIAEPPLRPDPEQEAVLGLWRWFAASDQAAAPVIASHPWFLRELAAARRLPAGGVPLVKRSAIEAAPPGTMIIWDSHYSIRPPEGMQLRDFKFDPRFRMRKESIATNRRFAAYALEKTASGPAPSAPASMQSPAAAPPPPPRHDGPQEAAGEGTYGG